MSQSMELKKILKLLGEKNIYPTPYKGVLLGQLAFQDIGLREVADIDMLVDLNDLPEIEALLLGRNYVPNVEMKDEFKPTEGRDIDSVEADSVLENWGLKSWAFRQKKH